MKNTHGGVLVLVKLTHLHECFSRFLNCTTGTKLHNASHIFIGRVEETVTFLLPVDTFKKKWEMIHSDLGSTKTI